MIGTFFQAKMPVSCEISPELISLIDGDFAVYVEGDSRFLLSYGRSPEEAVKNLKSLVKLVEGKTEKRVRAGRVVVTEMAYRDYLTKYKEFIKPVKIENRLVVLPYRDTPLRANAYRGMVQVTVESGLAFGTGMHPTTQLCLKYLLNTGIEGMRVADAGTGSGILAVAAAKLGASSVYAFDIDELAVEAASRNLKLNGVADRVMVIQSGMEILPELAVDVLVANLTEKDILENASWIIRSSIGKAGLSGFLLKDALNVADRFKRAGFRLVRIRRKKGWSLVEIERE